MRRRACPPGGRDVLSAAMFSGALGPLEPLGGPGACPPLRSCGETLGR